MSDQSPEKYPLLKDVLSAKGLPHKGVWTISDVAKILGVRNRAIYDWVKYEKLSSRNLPGHGKFLSEDLEEFLMNAKRTPKYRREDR